MGIINLFKKKKQSTATEAAVGTSVAAPVSPVPAEIVTERAPSTHSVAAQVLVKPLVTEKATMLQSLNQYVFEVTMNATKSQVVKAIADLYGVKPVAVRIVRTGGKQIRWGRSTGTTRSIKKAIVTLPAGKTIQLVEGV